MVKSKYKSLKHVTLFDTVVIILAAIIGLITVYPMWYVIVMSLSDPVLASGSGVWFWPKGFSVKSFEIVVQEAEFWITIRNSVNYVIIGTVIMLITTMLMAYPLTRKNLKGRKLITIYLLIPMYFGGGLIPTFIVVTRLGLYNSPWSAILLGSYSIWNVILCKTYLQSLPNDLSEAAQIDGAGNWRVLLSIYLPLSKPVLAVITIYTIVGIWNSWFTAQVYLTKAAIQPVQLYLKRVLIEQSAGLNTMKNVVMDQKSMEAAAQQAIQARQLKYAMIVIVTVPILMVYPMFQKYFVKGVMLGSLKG